MNNPWMKAVTLTTGSTAYNLWTLMKAADVSLGSLLGGSQACHLRLFVSLAAGAAKVYIGNEDVSTTEYGSAITSGQVFELGPFDLNLIDLEQVFLFSDTSGTVVGVTAETQ